MDQTAEKDSSGKNEWSGDERRHELGQGGDYKGDERRKESHPEEAQRHDHEAKVNEEQDKPM